MLWDIAFPRYVLLMPPKILSQLRINNRLRNDLRVDYQSRPIDDVDHNRARPLFDVVEISRIENRHPSISKKL